MGWTNISTGLIAVLGLLILSAGIEDARRRTIANWKNAAIALLAPVWWWANGLPLWPDVAAQLLIAAAMLLLFGFAFARGWMGGGDVKMIVALALWLPPGSFASMLVAMSLVGGAVTLAMVADRWVRRRREGAVEVPYGVAIAIAALLALREPILNQFA